MRSRSGSAVKEFCNAVGRWLPRYESVDATDIGIEINRKKRIGLFQTGLCYKMRNDGIFVVFFVFRKKKQKRCAKGREQPMILYGDHIGFRLLSVGIVHAVKDSCSG